MSGGAAAAAPAPGDPGRELNARQGRDQCGNVSPVRFTELCESAFRNGDYIYMSTALTANREGTREFIERTSASGADVTVT